MRLATQKLKTAAQSWAGLLLAGCVVTLAQAQQSITVAAYPAVDEIAKAAVAQWEVRLRVPDNSGAWRVVVAAPTGHEVGEECVEVYREAAVGW